MSAPEKAVLITPAMPSDRGNGLAMRAGLLLEGLAQSCAVTVLLAPVFARLTAPTAHAARFASEIRTLALAPADDPTQELVERLQLPDGPARARALHPLPDLARAATADAARQTAEYVGEAALVVVFRTYLLPLLDALLGRSTRPRLALDVDDVESLTQRQFGQMVQADRYERLEAHYVPLMDVVMTCSAADAEILGAAAVIPNAIRMPTLERAARAPDHDLLLVGNLSYAPNVEGATWLCHEVLPLLGGDVRVAIVGSDPVADVLALSAEHRVTVAPDVAELTPWYELSSVAVVPVHRGGGSRIKLIEALAHRRPVVSTSVGAAGLPWSDAESPVVHADTPEAFAACCRALLDDPARGRALGGRGAALVRERASVEAVVPQIDRVVRSMVRP